MLDPNMETAIRYYQWIVLKDVLKIETVLHANVTLNTPMGSCIGKENVLNAVEKYSQIVKKIEIKEKMSRENKVMLVYTLLSDVGETQTAVLLTFVDYLIFKIELFYDPQPFLKIFSTTTN